MIRKNFFNDIITKIYLPQHLIDNYRCAFYLSLWRYLKHQNGYLFYFFEKNPNVFYSNRLSDLNPTVVYYIRGRFLVCVSHKSSVYNCCIQIELSFKKLVGYSYDFSNSSRVLVFTSFCLQPFNEHLFLNIFLRRSFLLKNILV